VANFGGLRNEKGQVSSNANACYWRDLRRAGKEAERIFSNFAQVTENGRPTPECGRRSECRILHA